MTNLTEWFLNQCFKAGLSLLLFVELTASAQSFLPPVLPWKGKSEKLVVSPADPWITPCEKSGFIKTPTYQETMDWLEKLCKASSNLKLIPIGKSVEGRELKMVIASTDPDKSPDGLKKSPKPLLLAQAGIHSGEIDGKDAGMMLLRDIALKGKADLIKNVNFLFIPILNVDGHERSSPFNRPNQRGPENMGWRTNAQNLNLNRDYSKLDTKEIQAVVEVMNAFDPDLYLDIHVTDGADYQYDITYSWNGPQAHSPSIAGWLDSKFKLAVDKDLKSMGHIPGPFLNPTNGRDFTDGNTEFTGGPNFSDSYGNLRHLPSVLIETHSLKPYKQRVLGTYVLLEATLKMLEKEVKSLSEVMATDKNRFMKQVPYAWIGKEQGVAKDSMEHLGIKSEIRKSTISGGEYVAWLGKPETRKIPYFKTDQSAKYLARPKGYWVPASCKEVIERLQMHGIKMEFSEKVETVEMEMYRIREPVFASKSFEGHIQVGGKPQAEIQKRVLPQGSAYISTNQPLGDLAIVLLEPHAPESFLQWGFFHSIFQRTEYGEDYFLEPMAEQMLKDSPALKSEFETKKQSDPVFAKNPSAILNWFYEKSPYYDANYLLYPIGRVVN